MKYIVLPRRRQVGRDAGQPVLQKPDHQVVHLVRRLLLHRVPGARHAHERGARDPGGKRTAECNGHPPVLLPPQHHGCRCDAIETSFEGGEAKLPEHAPQSPRVRGLGRRGVVLIHVSLRDLACIKVGGPEKSTCEAPSTECEGYASQHWPPGDSKQQRLTGAQPGRPHEHQPPHALWEFDRDFSGDGTTHRVSDEHGIGKTQRVHEGDGEAGGGGAGGKGPAAREEKPPRASPRTKPGPKAAAAGGAPPPPFTAPPPPATTTA